MSPSLHDWTLIEWPQVVEARRTALQDPAWLPNAEWVILQMARRYGLGLAPGEAPWTLRKMLDHELRAEGGGAGGPGVPLPSTRVGLLVPDGAIFRLNGQPWRYKGVSAFKLCARFSAGEELDSFLDAYQGYNTLRVWDYVGPGWGADAWSGNTPAEWEAFCRYVGDRGWWVELTLLTDDDSARLEPARRLVAHLRDSGVPNLLLEAGNEPTTHKFIDTHALRSVLTSTPFPYSSGDYEDSDRWFGTYYTCHTARTFDWPRRAHDLLEFSTGAGPDKPHAPHAVPCLGDEPGKPQDVGAILSEWRAYFGGCSILGAGACFHSETGKLGWLPTFVEQGCARAALEGLDAFPADAPLDAYRRIVEPGQDYHARTYVVGNCAVRSQQQGLTFPEPGWRSLDPTGVLWTRG